MHTVCMHGKNIEQSLEYWVSRTHDMILRGGGGRVYPAKKMLRLRYTNQGGAFILVEFRMEVCRCMEQGNFVGGCPVG